MKPSNWMNSGDGQFNVQGISQGIPRGIPWGIPQGIPRGIPQGIPRAIPQGGFHGGFQGGFHIISIPSRDSKQGFHIGIPHGDSA